MRKIIVSAFTLIIYCAALGQPLWQKKIDNAQLLLCQKDSNQNCIINAGNNPETNLVITSYVITKVDAWQQLITNTTTYSNNDKVRYLRMLLNYVNTFNYYTKNKSRNRDYTINLARDLFANFDAILRAHAKQQSLADIIKPLSYLAAQIITEEETAPLALGYADAKDVLIMKDAAVHPERIMSILNRYPNLPNADSLLTIAAISNHDKIYDFAQCTKCGIYTKLKESTNPLVRTIFTMAQMESGRSLTPFLDAISKNEITIDSINKLQANPVLYYRLLVNTRIKYAQKLAAGEEIIALTNFNDKIKEQALLFVKQINDAHTKPDGVRFATLVPLNSKELYYVAVYGIDELFTSSFNRGVFAQFTSKLGGVSTYQLMQQVNNDYFRKFVKICANYNRLGDFLKLMPDSSGREVISNFVSNLVTNDNLQDIEDAVDVADAYAGIGATPSLKNISDLMLLKVKQYQQQYASSDDVKSETVYRLFDIIFNSYKDTSSVLSNKLNISPINKVTYSTLATKADKTVVKLYFYGDEDKDGQSSFQNFMGIFNDRSRWSVKPNPYYVEVNSIKGKPIQIFANRALYDPTKQSDPDDTAKLKMCHYMEKQKLVPTFVMHRGHSYHVPITLEYMERYDTSAKLIVLGSCGGYQNLQKVLLICPEAHIVSSKQTGTMRVNDPLLQELFADIGAAKTIIWPTLWPRVKARVGGGDAGEMFDEYIPPNRNLGMIFIKAYKKQMNL